MSSVRTRVDRPRIRRSQSRALQYWLVAIFIGSSFSLFFVDAVDAAINNRVFIGADGAWAFDQLQYLAWATDAAHHGLISNLYSLPASAHVFLHPVWLLTGLLHVNGGLSYALLLAIWKAIAIVALLAAVRAYARSLLGDDPRAVLLAMLIALFMVTPGYLILNGQIAGAQARPTLLLLEIFPVYWMMGYFPIALAVAAMILFLMQVSRLVSSDGPAENRGRRTETLLACAAGSAASWLHPWQGATLIFIVAGMILWQRPSWKRCARLLLPVLATGAPIVYYGLLARVDSGWAQSQSSTSQLGTLSAPILLTLAPLALLAVPGYIRPARTAAERMLKLWPLAIVVVYIVSPSDAHHALGGISVPLAVLSVRGWPVVRARLSTWSDRRMKALAVGAVCVAVVAAPAAIVRRVTAYRTTSQRAAELPRDDARALDAVAASNVPGGVLTTAGIGTWVPAVTGHATWVGHPVWTPHYAKRAQKISDLFDGLLARDVQSERRFVLSTGATFVLEPCGSHARLDQALMPAGFGIERIGCVTLYSRGRSLVAVASTSLH
jgi:hypothetical protein